MIPSNSDPSRAKAIFPLPARAWRGAFKLGWLLAILLAAVPAAGEAIIDTGQNVCYGTSREIDCPRPGQAFYGQDAQYRGNPPRYRDNGDGTVTDRATGLMWTRMDSGRAMRWQDALAYAESLDAGGHDDWRLPNAKELLYIVDYSRSPDTTHAPAIDPVFQTTAIQNEAGLVLGA